MPNSVIQVKNLVKRYGPLHAVDGISFEVKKGEVFGLLGENGAGKTTTLEIIEGLRKPSDGSVKVLGHNIKEHATAVKQRIGVQLQSSAYYNFLTLTEILDLFGSFYTKQRDPKELLAMVDLADKARSYVGNLSGGQRQRFSIVASLVNDPDIVFLDEPTTGLDPVARRHLWELIAKIKSLGTTIVLTTHYMEEAELLCDRIGIMEKGKILMLGTTHQLIAKAKYPFHMSFALAKKDGLWRKELEKLGKVTTLPGKSDHFEVHFPSVANRDKGLKLVQRHNPQSMTVGRATLEDVFIELTGKRIAAEEEREDD